ncbi:MAG TPA: hypothetical protein VHA80_13810 [Solirubrobacterales bacterium]|nr:hypothetical protein [Solirubrobacterales bacterium]
MRIAALAALALCATLLAAGCGGGGSANSSTTAPPPERTATPKQATAPNAPAGSNVISCEARTTGIEGLRATAIDCASARATMHRWTATPSCALPTAASRGSCSLDPFRCQAVRADRGVAVSCARRGGDVAFISTRE